MRFQFQRRGVPGKVYMVFPDRPGGRNLLLFFSMRPGPCARAAIEPAAPLIISRADPKATAAAAFSPFGRPPCQSSSPRLFARVHSRLFTWKIRERAPKHAPQRRLPMFISLPAMTESK
jgi:hypothetical protein